MLTNDIISFEQLSPGYLNSLSYRYNPKYWDR